jgi:hypothetical protein
VHRSRREGRTIAIGTIVETVVGKVIGTFDTALGTFAAGPSQADGGRVAGFMPTIPHGVHAWFSPPLFVSILSSHCQGCPANVVYKIRRIHKLKEMHIFGGSTDKILRETRNHGGGIIRDRNAVMQGRIE